MAMNRRKNPITFYMEEILIYVTNYPVENIGDIQIALDMPDDMFQEAWSRLVKVGAVSITREGRIQ